MKAAIICFTTKGSALAQRIAGVLRDAVIDAEVWCKKRQNMGAKEGSKQQQGMQSETRYKQRRDMRVPFKNKEPIAPWEGTVRDWAEREFYRNEALIFVGATGIAVRSIAPFLESKATDPAVIVVDELATFVISLISGHIGGANELCEMIAGGIGAVPVITTATDRNELFAVDVFARKNGLWISDLKLAKWISADLLDGNRAGFFSEFPVDGKVPKGLAVFQVPKDEPLRKGESDPRNREMDLQKERTNPQNRETGLGINDRGFRNWADWMCSNREHLRYGIEVGIRPGMREIDAGEIDIREKETGERTDEDSFQIYIPELLFLVPKIVSLGIGCKKGKSAEDIEQFVLDTLEKENISIQAVERICSIDLKAREEGILIFCRKYGIPFETYSAERLQSVDGAFNASPFVAATTGVDNVCERSAVLGSKGGRLILSKQAKDGMTLAAAAREWRAEF